MNLDDLLKVNSVRCIKTKVDEDLVEGETYRVEGFNDEAIKIVDRNAYSSWHNKNLFEPVPNNGMSKSNSEIDMSDNSVNTVNTTFKVGDKVYKYGKTDVKTVSEVFEDGYMRISSYPHRVNHEVICHATQENYEMLCKLYPHIEFEQPPKELKGSDLARAMLEKGWKFVPCFVSDENEWDAVASCNTDNIISYEDGEFWSNDSYQYAVPFDPRTGEPLTESILND